MAKNIQLKIVSILLFISGLLTLLLVSSSLLKWNNLAEFLLSLLGLDITGFVIVSYYFTELGLIRIIFPLFFIGLAIIDLLCAFYVHKGNRIFRTIAVIRSLLASLSGIGLIYLAFNSELSIVEGLFYLIYYGVIFILLLLSRKASASVIPTEG